MNDKRKLIYYFLLLLLILLFVEAIKHVAENDFRLLFGCVLGGVCLYVTIRPKHENSDATTNPEYDKRNKLSPLIRTSIWCFGIFACSIIGAINRIFTTPLYTGANDIGVAGLGNLLYHPMTHGPKGAIEGAVIGSAITFVAGLIRFLRNHKESKLPPVIQNESD